MGTQVKIIEQAIGEKVSSFEDTVNSFLLEEDVDVIHVRIKIMPDNYYKSIIVYRKGNLR